jgi:two-component system LytT family sensor kinase
MAQSWDIPSDHQMPTRRSRRAWLWVAMGIVAVPAIAGFFAADLLLLNPTTYGGPAKWKQVYLLNLAYFGGWAALAPLIVGMTVRLPLTRSTWRRSLTLQAIASLGMSALQITFLELVMTQMPRPGPYWHLSFWKTVAMSLGINLQGSLAMYWTICGAAYAWSHHQRYQRESLRASRLETFAADARYRALAARIMPHFLFNTLNSIAALVDEEPQKAKETIAQLGALLRQSIESDRRTFAALGNELQLLEDYLTLERIRYGDRLSVRWEVSVEARERRIPALVLQPLVENALRHGLARSMRPISLCIRGGLRDGRLVVEVADDGPGAEVSGVREGVGLSAVRARLQAAYGARHAMEITTAPAGGFSVRLEMPAEVEGQERWESAG